MKRPALADLRESGAIEQDADLVLGQHWAAYYTRQKKPALGDDDPGFAAWNTQWLAEKNELEICVLKNRNGPTGIARAHIDVAASAIRNRTEDVPTVQYPKGYA